MLYHNKLINHIIINNLNRGEIEHGTLSFLIMDIILLYNNIADKVLSIIHLYIDNIMKIMNAYRALGILLPLVKAYFGSSNILILIRTSYLFYGELISL